MTPLGIGRQTSPIINEAGHRFYFHPDTLATGKELGLDGFRFYFLGRGGVLRDVEPAVIVAAFGYFSPGVVEAAVRRLAGEPLPDHPAARAYRNVCILSELRGSVHLLAIVATWPEGSWSAGLRGRVLALHPHLR